jgi:glycosyltransferase involved in cell wall biosynthesis
MSVREMLHQLDKRGLEVHVLGATVFDTEDGLQRLRGHWARIKASTQKLVNVKDGNLVHQLVKTRSTVRGQLLSEEADFFLSNYLRELHNFKPDLVWFYGGGSLDFLVPHEARLRGIPSAAYLVNGNYKASAWCRDVDSIITDSQATADYYVKSQGFKPVPVGTFIDPNNFVAPKNSRKRILFVNPSYTKGVAIVVQLALLLEKRRPDIIFEVVESRGNWHQVLKAVSSVLGTPRDQLDNVVVTPNTADMRPLYGRARLLLAPSLWYESGARVLAEALLNGIPVIITNRGGGPEMIGDAGIKLNLPEKCHQAPYTSVPATALLQPLVERIEALYDNESMYAEFVKRAYRVGAEKHGIDGCTDRLLTAFKPLLDQQAGDKDHADLLKRHHKHNV